ncbi:LexA/Signal peptidase [Dacryopinax primogenitus]|uniref:Mitochondrial inner membrane protease subunit 2 n=1 Tax=Dacryopinax primogenitus (strain DJM 731) TaxID=1858805 RepID=M5GBP6_DACPD|nr:LexA/Signal peptidase [Dacryopinax primogenitus]EJU06404.1 LexA/Signal peptidase [Dacryopinax primogenitus]
MSFYYSFLRSRFRLRPIIDTLAWVPFGIMFTQVGYSVINIKGNSMQPTFNPESSLRKDMVLLNRFVAWWDVTQLKRGDVITLRDPTNPDLLITKRILALEGDLVRTLPPYPDTYVRIPPSHAWVEGDEPFRSSDSNHFGPVSLSLVDARVEAILWPLDRMRVLHGAWQAAAEEREGKRGDELERLIAEVGKRPGRQYAIFWKEMERARGRMQRVYVHGGMEGVGKQVLRQGRR